MKYKIYNKSIKIEIVKRYLQGERINNLTKKIWLNVKGYHRHKNIYNWIAKYGNDEWYYHVKKIKPSKKEIPSKIKID